MMGSEFLLVLLMFFGVGPTSGNDALDMIPSAAYWEAKHVTPSLEQLEQDAAVDKAPGDISKFLTDLASDDFKTRNTAKKALEAMGPAIAPLLKPAAESKDPEVAATATALIKQFSEHGAARSVRRLMAIRTLGERKEKDALTLLKTLADSKELFVSDYAARSTAAIEGKPFAHPDHKKEVLADLQLLPKGTGIVGQSTGMPAAPLTLDKVVEMALDPANQAMMGGMGGPMNKPMDKKKMLAKLTAKSLDILERVGDVRIDGVTLGISEDIGPHSGSGIVALRGKYDEAAMVAAIKATAGDDVKLTHEGNVDILETGPEMTAVFPSNDQLLIVFGDRNIGKTPIVEKLLAVLTTGKGEFNENKATLDLIKTVDTAAPAWAVIRLNADMQKEKPFDACKTITLTTKMVKDNLAFTFTAQGDDAEKLKASADDLTTNIQAGIAQMKQFAAQMKQFQTMIDVMESIKITTDGKTGTLTGEIKSTITSAIAGSLPMWMMESGALDEDAPDMLEPADPHPRDHGGGG